MSIKERFFTFLKQKALAPQVDRIARWEKVVIDIPEATRPGENSPVRFNIPREGLKIQGDHLSAAHGVEDALIEHGTMLPQQILLPDPCLKGIGHQPIPASGRRLAELGGEVRSPALMARTQEDIVNDHGRVPAIGPVLPPLRGIGGHVEIGLVVDQLPRSSVIGRRRAPS